MGVITASGTRLGSHLFQEGPGSQVPVRVRKKAYAPLK